MMQIDRVTITGADDSTDIQWMRQVSERFPFVEWGILASSSQQGGYRFPSLDWMFRLNDEFNFSKGLLNLSLHVCGSWVREICAGNWTPLFTNHGVVLQSYSRVQLNFHAYEHLLSDQFFDAARKRSTENGWQLIFQIDGVNDHLVSNAYDEGIDAVPLYDRSGGAGIVPGEWPTQMSGIYSGYAGGLGPDNVLTEVERIEQVAQNDGTIWIDMETKVRTDDDSELCRSSVLRVLEKCLQLPSLAEKAQS